MTWHQSLQNRTILISGASSGIGKACAIKFAQNGANLILLARRLDRLEQLAQELTSQYAVQCDYFRCDVTKMNDIQAIGEALGQRPIDVLINNAGLALGMDKIQHANPQDWDVMIDTNIKGLLYLTRLVLPNMLEKNYGHIINIGSISAHGVYEGGAVYCATKHAVDAISRALRLDLFGTSIRVSEVSPGLLESEFSQVRYRGDLEKADKVYANTRPLVPEDIAEIAAYCVAAPAHVNISEVIVWPTAQAGMGKLATKK